MVLPWKKFGWAWAAAPHSTKVTPMAKTPNHSRFSILDFRLSEDESLHRIQELLFMLFPSIPTFSFCLFIFTFAYLMSLSARPSTLGGIVRPICLAALRLTMNSNFIGCSTGRSEGLAP